MYPLKMVKFPCNIVSKFRTFFQTMPNMPVERSKMPVGWEYETLQSSQTVSFTQIERTLSKMVFCFLKTLKFHRLFKELLNQY